MYLYDGHIAFQILLQLRTDPLETISYKLVDIFFFFKILYILLHRGLINGLAIKKEIYTSCQSRSPSMARRKTR